MRLLMTAALGVLLSFSATALAADAPSDPKAAFNAGTAEWAAAYNAGEPDRIVALYSEDAIVMPPDARSRRIA